MYEFPYGAGQQLNLNWIINEIITLHKRLDPDWELPNFDNAFPYMNLNQLNLDWILRELKAIKDLAPAEDAQLLKMVANALIANTYDTETQYNVDDIVYRDSDNRLYKCITATPAGGEPFDSTKWVEVDVSGVLTDLLVNGAVANAVTDVRYDNHKIQQKINGTYSDVISVEDAPTDNSDRLPSSKAVYNLNGALNSLETNIGGTVTISTQADLISKSKFFNASANIVLGSTGVTLEQYARGAIFSNDGQTGTIIAVGSSGAYYFAFFSGGSITKAQKIGKPTYGSATNNTNFVSSDTQVRYRKDNNMLMVFGPIVLSANATTNDVLVSGIPQPGGDVQFSGVIIDNPSYQNLRGMVARFKLTWDGKIVPWYNSIGHLTDSGATIMIIPFNVLII